MSSTVRAVHGLFVEAAQDAAGQLGGFALDGDAAAAAQSLTLMPSASCRRFRPGAAEIGQGVVAVQVDDGGHAAPGA